jgi:16S rRNA processing protein RimM
MAPVGAELESGPADNRKALHEKLARAEALPPRPGEFDPWQLEGAAVETPDGRALGRFVRVEDSPAQPLWVIERDGREWLLPAVPEFVLDVSVAERRIVANPPEGLDTL